MNAVNIEAALLTGGESRRMGRDKASLPIDGVPQALRMARSLQAAGIPVTTLGKEPVEGYPFLPDEVSGMGPMAALGRFVPQAGFVFVASCDLPRFDARLVHFLHEHIGNSEAAVPLIDGWRQPLCALYRADAFGKLAPIAAEGGRCAMKWLDALNVTLLDETALASAGLDPAMTRGANTPEELHSLIHDS